MLPQEKKWQKHLYILIPDADRFLESLSSVLKWTGDDWGIMYYTACWARNLRLKIRKWFCLRSSCNSSRGRKKNGGEHNDWIYIVTLIERSDCFYLSQYFDIPVLIFQEILGLCALLGHWWLIGRFLTCHEDSLVLIPSQCPKNTPETGSSEDPKPW